MTPLEAYKLLEAYLIVDNSKNLPEWQQALVNKYLKYVQELIKQEK
ncbi:hypothetical protein [Enterococcus italicus]